VATATPTTEAALSMQCGAHYKQTRDGIDVTAIAAGESSLVRGDDLDVGRMVGFEPIFAR